MSVQKIDKIEDVLQNAPSAGKIVDYYITRLTAAGENYGSLMLRLEIKVFNEETKVVETLHLVAKLLPPNELLQKMFNIQVTYRNEVGFYSVIVPLLEEFQKDQGVNKIVDIFPKYYGSRLSLNPENKIVDKDAILILENLKSAGFTMATRTVGFDLNATRLLVKNLAYFHATSLAFKLKKPDLFEKQVKPYLVDYHFSDIRTELAAKRTVAILKEHDQCWPYLDKVQKQILQKSIKNAYEPFATISHNDYWVNNMMVKYEDGRAVANKMLDFQVIEYKSPCRDLIFFLFTSVELTVLKEHLDEFIDLYYESFVGKLEELKCDITLFSRETFNNELELAAKESEYFHVIFMLYPIYTDPADVKESNKISLDYYTAERVLSSALKERILTVTLEFIRKGWLD